MNLKRFLLFFIFVASLLLFGLSVFKNISYPLLWGDEAETVVFAERILKFGYPKVHDGKNSLNLTMVKNKSIGVKKSVDAWIHLPWLQYYYAVPGVWLASDINDLYVKTRVVRLPFAIAGTFGILIYAFSAFPLFKGRKLEYLTAFLLLSAISVPLVLNLREVRSYSLTFLLLALIFLVFNYYYFFKKLSSIVFATTFIIFSILLLNNFTPAFVICIIAIACYVVFEILAFRLKDNKTVPFCLLVNSFDKKRVKVVFLTLLATLIISIPFYVFYETIYISREVAKEFVWDISSYLGKLVRIMKFYSLYDFLPVVLILKIFLYALLKDYSRRVNKLSLLLENYLRVSSFFIFFFVVYLLIISNMPYIFDRYYIALQPILSMSIIIDVVLYYKIISLHYEKKLFKSLIYNIYVVAGVFLVCSVFKFDTIAGHVYELTHIYKGPLDYVIPYIHDNYNNPENLVIETNIEQTPYIYYLGSSAFRETSYDTLPDNEPDIIIPKKYPNLGYQPSVIDKLLKDGSYQKITFPIADYPANNISEFSFSLKHLFKTRIAGKETDRLVIYINENSKNK